MNKKGQLSIDNLLNWLILLIFAIVVTTVARPMIASAISSSTNDLETFALMAILPIFWILIIGILAYYARPQVPQY